MNHDALLDAALAFHGAGCIVVPARVDGTKSPAFPAWQNMRPTEDDIREWFRNGRYDGFGLVCGSASGNLEMLEFEGRAVADNHVAQLAEVAQASGLGELWERINNGYKEATPGGGIHLLYRVSGPVAGNTKLARRPGPNGQGVEVLVETRGQNGYVIVAPSGGRTHPQGGAWFPLHGNPSTIPTITPDERDALHTLARTLDQMPIQEDTTWRASSADSSDTDGSHGPSVIGNSRTTAGAAAGSDGPNVADDYNARTTWAEILQPKGWQFIYKDAAGVCYWRRPGKNQGISATTGKNAGDNLYVFTTSTTFDSERPYSKFAAYAHLHHAGNYSQAAKTLYAAGYGTRTPKEPTWITTVPTTNGSTSTTRSANALSIVVPSPKNAADAENPDPIPTESQANPTEEPRERTSWWPRDLAPVLAGHDPEPPPTILTRNDNQPLLYAGKVNALLGESESGKTWVALLAVAQQLAAQQSVLYLDFEDTAPGIISRLRALQVPDNHLAQLTYIGPDETLHTGAAADLAETLQNAQPALIVIDGVNAAMTLLGLNLIDNTDATRFAQSLLRPLTRTGACVLTIDHVPKNAEMRGKGGIGAQAKRAMITGSSIAVDVIQPFGRGMSGRLKLTVDKDRPGHVRAASGGGKQAGIAHLDSDADSGLVTLRIQPPDLRPPDERGTFRPTYLMERVSRYLEIRPEGANRETIKREVSGKAAALISAVDRLLEEGFLRVEGGINYSTRPYRETDETDSLDVERSHVPGRSPTFPGTGQELGERRSPSVSPPVGGGTWERRSPDSPPERLACRSCGNVPQNGEDILVGGRCVRCRIAP